MLPRRVAPCMSRQCYVVHPPVVQCTTSSRQNMSGSALSSPQGYNKPFTLDFSAQPLARVCVCVCVSAEVSSCSRRASGLFARGAWGRWRENNVVFQSRLEVSAGRVVSDSVGLCGK